MKHVRYSLLFAVLSMGFTVVALASYRAISAVGNPREDADFRWPDDTLPTRPVARHDTAGIARAYATIAAADEPWRRQHAKQYTLDELRARGDGRRTPRQAMQDRVYRYARTGDRGSAILELERWVGSNRHDANTMLWLARLLHEDGRSGEAVPLYRRALAIESGER